MDRWVKLCAHGHDPYQTNLEGGCAMGKLKTMPSNLETRVLKAMADHERAALLNMVSDREGSSVDIMNRPRL